MIYSLGDEISPCQSCSICVRIKAGVSDNCSPTWRVQHPGDVDFGVFMRSVRFCWVSNVLVPSCVCVVQYNNTMLSLNESR